MVGSNEAEVDYAVRGMANRLVLEYLRFLTAIVHDTQGYATNFKQNEGGKTVQFVEVSGAFENFKTVIDQEAGKLFRTTSMKIAKYAEDFSVDPTKMDAYKFFYWFCETCMERFPTGIESQLAKLGMSRGMNELLQRDVGKRLAPVMSKKITQTVLTGRMGEVFGIYGLYKVFKNCSLLCRYRCSVFPKRQYDNPLFA